MAWLEIATTLGGATTGFLMKMAAIKSQQSADLMKTMVTGMQANTKSADAAVNRVSIDAGRFTRRIIVFSVLFSVILMPFLAPLFGMDLIVEGVDKTEGFLFGLIGAGEEQVFTPIKGVLLIPELRQALLAIIAFYFGQAAAKVNG